MKAWKDMSELEYKALQVLDQVAAGEDFDIAQGPGGEVYIIVPNPRYREDDGSYMNLVLTVKK